MRHKKCHNLIKANRFATPENEKPTQITDFKAWLYCRPAASYM